MSCILCALLFIAYDTNAGSAKLTWDANTEEDLQGYKIYYDTTSHSADVTPDNYNGGISVADDANTGYWLDNLTPGQTYYFQVTAVDTSLNESNCSVSPGEVSKLITYRGDINNTPDHRVNINDFTLFAANYGSALCGPSNKADINRDCTVNINDFTILASEYGQSF